MKLIAAGILTIISSLIFFSCTEDQIQCTRVTGGTETETRSISGYSKIFFKDVGNIYIAQGQEYQFRAEGQRVVLDALETSVNNEELLINLNKCFNGDAYTLDIYITLPEIDEIEMAGVGNVIAENEWASENLTLILSGISETFDIQGKIDSLSTVLTGDGNISLSGESRTHLVRLSGVGNVEAYDLPTITTKVTMNGNGNCYINAAQTIDAQINSSGNVFYIGNPEIEVSGEGSGQIINNN